MRGSWDNRINISCSDRITILSHYRATYCQSYVIHFSSVGNTTSYACNAKHLDVPGLDIASIEIDTLPLHCWEADKDASIFGRQNLIKQFRSLTRSKAR